MLRSVARASAALLGSAVAVAALAVPAAADGYLPDGCVGTVVYACTGTAQPPGSGYNMDAPLTLPVTVTEPTTPILPSRTVDGAQLGGVIVGLGPQTVPGPYIVIGPTESRPSGVVLPVDVCAFTTCLQAGTPVMIPGLPLPVVPVNIPSVTVPGFGVPVPLVAVPGQTTPAVSAPAVDEHVVTMTLYVGWHQLYVAAENTCRMGGGTVQYTGRFPFREECTFSPTSPAANALLLAYEVSLAVRDAALPVAYGVRDDAVAAREEAEREIDDLLGYLRFYLGDVVPGMLP